MNKKAPDDPRRFVFHFAEQYVSRGWSVIPLEGKQPPNRFSWKCYQNRRTTLGEIVHWFGKMNPHRYDVGIVTGRVSGLTVVDCDTRSEPVWWWNNHPRTPLVVKTGRGGCHFYYLDHPDVAIGNRAGILQRKIDIRGNGGYVIAPPSIHAVSGLAYAWVDESKYNLEAIPLFDPAWIDSPARSAAVDGTIHDGIAYIAKIRAIPGQGGHNATFRAACRLRDAGLSEAEAMAALIEWNATNAEPPWTIDELTHKIVDAYRMERHPT
jgi:hypothetical protein